MKRLMFAVLMTALVAGCSAQQRTPVGTCYTVGGAYEVAQITILGAVKAPQITEQQKTVLKQVDLRATQALQACADAAIKGDTDKVSFSIAMIAEATRIGSAVAVEVMTNESE